MKRKEIEISHLDCRYESYRLKTAGAEKILLNSILVNGIRDPLQVVEKEPDCILLDGFKRWRCAKILGLTTVPCYSLGKDEASCIIELLRLSNARSLSILEQAKLIDDLITVHNMCNADIAQMLEKSKSWVSVRTGIIKEMSTDVMKSIFNGDFPVYCYMYTLRQFMRLNYISAAEIDEFVKAVAGKKLSTREIDTLANGFFRGSNEIREQIKNGKIEWSLDRLKAPRQEDKQCTERERMMLKTLEISLKYMQKILHAPWDTRFKTSSFMAQSNLLSGGILRVQEDYSEAVRKIYDRSGEAKSHCNAPQ